MSERPTSGLVLRFDELGAARARVESGARLDLGGGRSFEGLHALDARGRALPARFVWDVSGLGILVDDRGAVYPVSVDPWVQQAVLTASDAGNSDQFGYSVAVSGDTVVVGAVGANSGGADRGQAYVFTKPQAGWATSSTAAILSASDAANSDIFGWSVGVSGDTVVVGAVGANSGGTDRGQAYVFVKPGGGWANMTQTAILTASDKVDFDQFGFVVGVSGDTAVVGAYGADSGGTNRGQAYVFVKPGGGWANMTQTAILTASDKANGDELGISVGVSGDTIAVGARYADSGGTNRGQAYVFVKPGGGWANMTQTAILTASDKADNDNFGYSVAVSGDTVVAGAYLSNSNGTDRGQAYAFTLGANDGFLTGLSLSSGVLSPAFSAGSTEYSARVRGSSIETTSALWVGASVQVRVNGGAWGVPRALPLNTGRNVAELLVTAPDTSTRTYMIVVVRESSRAGYCLAGRFLDLELGQPDSDPVYRGVIPSWFVDGKGITCDTPPYGYVLDGKAPGTKGVPDQLYPYWRTKS